MTEPRQNPPRALSPDEIDAVVERAVRSTLLQIGIVTTNDADMRETQKDFSYLRDLRTGSQAMKNKGVLAMLGIVITAISTLIWLGLNAVFNHGTVPTIPHIGG